jgi:hypothetical protein
MKTISPTIKKNLPYTIIYLYFFRDFCLKFYLNTTNFHLFYNILNFKLNKFNENNNNIKIIKEMDYSHIKYSTNYIHYFEICSPDVTCLNLDYKNFDKNFKERIEYAFKFQDKKIIY